MTKVLVTGEFLPQSTTFSIRFWCKMAVHRFWGYKPKLKGGILKFYLSASKTLHILQPFKLVKKAVSALLTLF